MTEHSFDPAAALLDQAVERLNRRDYGITRILFHEFGDCILNANHTTHDTGHSVKMWAYDNTASWPPPKPTPPTSVAPRGRGS